ncbi:MAG: type IV pilus twitching motility protein PilT [Elusimicrobiota bacterium]
MTVSIDKLLELMFEKEASDLHIHSGSPPILRIDGELKKATSEELTGDQCQNIIYSILTEKQKEVFEGENELDLSFGVKGLGRVRMNVYMQRQAVCASMRAIPNKFYTFEELGLPGAVNDVVKLPVGLVLVTGPTGSGKSTTLASIINYLNENRKSHIVTIEDPIEYVHEHKDCLVSQRELGSDTKTFPTALKYAMRQDPDIIMVGEMRDVETIAAALTIAETGHLVFATLHTPDAPQSINRIIDVFPPHQQPQIRSQLSMVLQAVFCQKLLQRSKHKGGGLALAVEVLMVTPGIRNMIREDKTEQIGSAMQTGGNVGMQTMNQALYRLYKKGDISYEQALEHCSDKKDMKRIIGGSANNNY